MEKNNAPGGAVSSKEAIKGVTEWCFADVGNRSAFCVAAGRDSAGELNVAQAVMGTPDILEAVFLHAMLSNEGVALLVLNTAKHFIEHEDVLRKMFNEEYKEGERTT